MKLDEFVKRLDKEMLSTAYGTQRSIRNVSSDIDYALQNKKEITGDDIKKTAEKYGLKDIEPEQIIQIAKELKRSRLARQHVQAKG
jgi:hypothetical protein